MFIYIYTFIIFCIAACGAYLPSISRNMPEVPGYFSDFEACVGHEFGDVFWNTFP